MEKQSYNILTDPFFNTFGRTPTTENIYNSLAVGGTAMFLGALARAIERYRVSDKPYFGIDVKKSLDNTIQDPLLSEKDIKELTTAKDTKKSKDKPQEKHAGVDWSKALSWAGPAAAGVFGFALGSRYKDRQYEQEDSEELDEQRAILDNIHKQVINARMLNARGQLSEEAYQKLLAKAMPILAKNASLNKKAGVLDIFQSAGGLLMATAFALSAYGSYKYFSKRNPNNMKYEAIKKGLKEYSANSSNLSPIGQDLTDSPELLGKLISQDTASTPTVNETPMDNISVSI